MAASSKAAHDCYKMDARPKGICLIFNNFEFQQNAYLESGHADKENLSSTFKNLDFHVQYFENQTCAQMRRVMEGLQNIDHSNYNCFVCCISSHGSKTGVCGTDDSTIPITELQGYVYSTRCGSLAGKPNIFFVDACRGGERHTGVYQSRSAAPTRKYITEKRDFLLSFATTPDNVSYSSPDPRKGSLFFFHLTRLLTDNGARNTIIQILQKLNEALNNECPSHAQTAEFTSTLSKDLRFYNKAGSQTTGPSGPSTAHGVRSNRPASVCGDRVIVTGNSAGAQYSPYTVQQQTGPTFSDDQNFHSGRPSPCGGGVSITSETVVDPNTGRRVTTRKEVRRTPMGGEEVTVNTFTEDGPTSGFGDPFTGGQHVQQRPCGGQRIQLCTSRPFTAQQQVQPTFADCFPEQPRQCGGQRIQLCTSRPFTAQQVQPTFADFFPEQPRQCGGRTVYTTRTVNTNPACVSNPFAARQQLQQMFSDSQDLASGLPPGNHQVWYQWR